MQRAETLLALREAYVVPIDRIFGGIRYNVAACASMMVPGEYGFIAQLNEGRASKKRPTEFRVDQVGACATEPPPPPHASSQPSAFRR